VRTPSKKTLFLSSLGVLSISILAGISLSPMAGILIACATTNAGLFWSILSLIYDTRADFQAGLERLALEIAKTQDEFAARAGLPLLTQYMELQDDDCPLFKQAADEVYQDAKNRLTKLHQHELHTDNLEQAYRWLEFLFRDFGPLREVKAISSGEFNEWRATDSWWIKRYLRLHQLAHERGIRIERIFIIKAKHQLKTYEDIFQRNVEYHVKVKLALHGRVGSADHKIGNCILFYTERKEPVYALVAQHDKHGELEHIIVYRDPQKIKHIVESYERIDSVAKSYSTVTAADLEQSVVVAPRMRA
jgi:hypothetical protein